MGYESWIEEQWMEGRARRKHFELKLKDFLVAFSCLLLFEVDDENALERHKVKLIDLQSSDKITLKCVWVLWRFMKPDKL